MSLLPSSKKKEHKKGEKNTVEIKYNQGWACKKCRNKEGMRTQ